MNGCEIPLKSRFLVLSHGHSIILHKLLRSHFLFLLFSHVRLTNTFLLKRLFRL